MYTHLAVSAYTCVVMSDCAFVAMSVYTYIGMSVYAYVCLCMSVYTYVLMSVYAYEAMSFENLCIYICILLYTPVYRCQPSDIEQFSTLHVPCLPSLLFALHCRQWQPLQLSNGG